MSDLPRELRTLALTVFEAQDLALSGEIADGYRCLQGGLARAVECQEFGDPWAAELVERYQDALRRYGEQYGAGPGAN